MGAEVLSANRSESLFDAYAESARRRPQARLVVGAPSGGTRSTLGETLEVGGRLAAGLANLGLGKGDVIAVLGGYGPEYCACVAAAAWLGAVLLPLPPHTGARETGFALREARARVLLHAPQWRNINLDATIAEAGDLPDLCARIAWGGSPAGALAWNTVIEDAPLSGPLPASGEDLALLIYSSGTTAEPKGVLHRGDATLSKIRCILGTENRDLGGVLMAAWPAGTIGGVHALMRFLVGGQDVVLMEHWNPELAARLVEDLSVDFFAGGPVHLQGMLDAADTAGLALSSLTVCSLGGAPVRSELVERCEARGITGFRAYGSTEHPFSTYGSVDEPRAKRLATDGRPTAGVEMRIVDDEGQDLPSGERGEIVSRGPELFAGYRKSALNEAAFLPGGWYRTGDIGSMDEDGYLMVSDRKKDVIIRGGENISAEEVEGYLLQHPMVIEAAAVAAPDARLGEVVCAFLVLTPGTTLGLDDIDRHFRALGVTRRKTPERLQVVSALPRNVMGKLLKQELRQSLAAPRLSP